MSDNNNDINEILADFKAKKEERSNPQSNPLEPPRQREDYIDFSKNQDDSPEKQEKKQKKSPQEIEQAREERRQKQKKIKAKIKALLLKIRAVALNKKFLICVGVIILAVALAFAVRAVVISSKDAYLKPYREKYPDVVFQSGVLEKYCDVIGENPNTVGYLEIDDIELKTPVSSEKGSTAVAEACTKGATQFNYVVYLDDNRLESIYSTAQGYNNSTGYMRYSDLFNDYTFKIVGAYYTNTDEKDDAGYIFPYNVTEKMTVDCSRWFVSALQSRFIYRTGADITRQDTLLTISCPTDKMENFRFVVVGVLRDNADSKSVAKAKENVLYPKAMQDDSDKDNPYRFEPKRYPEIIITDSAGNESTIEKTLDDYNKTIDN